MFKWLTDRSLPYSTGNSTLLFGRLDGKGVLGGMDICVCIAEFLCYPFETIDNCLAAAAAAVAAAAAASLQSCLTLCNPIDGSPPGSPVPGILQARILEWVTVCFSNA